MIALYIAIGIVVGGVLGFAIASMLVAKKSRAEIADLSTRAIGAEARVEELRTVISDADTDFDKLRGDLQSAQTERSAAVVRLQEIEKKIADYDTLLKSVKESMSETFKALAADTLSNSTKDLLTAAEERFRSISNLSNAELESRKQAVEQLVKPLHELVSTYKSEVTQVSERAAKESAAIAEQIRQLPTALTSLQTETSKLTRALRTPQVRGRWGEITLRKTVELAGMNAYCDFSEQITVSTESGQLRPDMIVRLPAGREVVVDSKVPLLAYLEAIEAVTEEERSAALKRHADLVKKHISALSNKKYWDQFEKSPDFVVMFIPNDSFLAAAAEVNQTLVELALEERVMPATPTTLVALLRAIEYGWRQETITENAERIAALGADLADRLAVFSRHFETMGKSIQKSVESYNDAIRSFESRVMVTARRFAELGAPSRKNMSDLNLIDIRPDTASADSITQDRDDSATET